MINRIGYTDDGLVFLVIDGEIENRPVQSITQMDPAMARKMAEGLLMASIEAERVKNERNGANLNQRGHAVDWGTRGGGRSDN